MDEGGAMVNMKISDNRKEKLTTMMVLGLESFKVFMACMLSLFVSQKCDDHVCNISDKFHDDTWENEAVLGYNFITLFVFLIGYNIEYMREQYIIHHFNNNPKLSDHNIIKIISQEPNVKRQLLMWNKRFYYVTLMSIGLGAINFGVSGLFICYYHYNGTRTLTSLVTNVLLVSNTVYSNYKISKKSHEKVFALSSSRLEPISYNDFDDKIKESLKKITDPTSNIEESKETSQEQPLEQEEIDIDLQTFTHVDSSGATPVTEMQPSEASSGSTKPVETVVS